MRNIWVGVALLGLGACGSEASDWEGVTAPEGELAMVDVWTFSEANTWFVNGSADVHRFDGNSWSTLATGASGVNCLFALSENEIYLCAGDQVLVYNGSTFAPLGDLSTTGLRGPVDIWASSATDIWVVGNDSLAGHYDGAIWQRVTLPSSPNQSVWGAGPDNVYALGVFALMHYDGSSWSEFEPDGQRISGDGQVWGTGANDVWVSTGTNELYHFDGSSWSLVELDDFVGDISTFWGSSSNNIWAAGTAGSIARYDGSEWEEIDHQTIGAPYLRQHVAMHGSSDTNIWIVGHQLGEGGATPRILRYEP